MRFSCSPLNPAGRGYLLCATNSTLPPPPAPPKTSAAAEDEQNDETETDDWEDEEEEEEDDDEEKEHERISPGTKCQLKCPAGYEMHGEYELTCRSDGTWDGPAHGECLSE